MNTAVVNILGSYISKHSSNCTGAEGYAATDN